MLVVNLYGGPGAGKSTGAAYIFSLLKMAGVNCELVNEFAKQLVWEDRKKAFTDQYYIFAKQHHRLHIIKDEVDAAIVDSPLLLNNLYGLNNGCPDCFYQLVDHVDRQYNNLNFFIERVNPFKAEGRLQDEKESDLIAVKLAIMLSIKMGPDQLMFVSGDVDGYNQIYDKILEVLNATI